MSQSKSVNFLKKALRSVKTSRNFFFLILSTCLVTLFVLSSVNNQQSVPITKPANQHDFDWLRNRNHLPLYVRPDQNTTIVVPHNVEAIKASQFIACFVISAPTNNLARYAIRQTWGRLIKPLFLIGVGDNETMASVYREAELFNDIIVEDFVDSYINLTIKTAFAMKNFLRYFEHSKYFFKIDDDVYLHVENLFKALEQAPSNSLFGRLETHSKPIRDETHKWYVPTFLYPDDEFPPYFNGPAYMIPGHMIRSIYEMSMKIPYLNVEDVFFTGLIAGKILNYTLHDKRRFKSLPSRNQWTCMYEHHISVHGLNSDQQLQLWQDFQQKTECNYIQKAIFFYERWQEKRHNID